VKPPVPLSVLDLAPIPSGSTAAEALARSTDLVRLAEELGYARHWVAEHHTMPGIASSAPAVLIAHLAAVTTTIRVGAGGVMLPNHPPLVVAEQFGTLQSLHPGRIDLGIGRAPGTDQTTALALRRSAEALSADDFPDQLVALLGFFTGSWPEGHPYSSMLATPGLGALPQMWLLGSSGYSAQVAGLLGLPFAFAHHFSSRNTLPALELYRQRFRPSDVLSEPYAMIAAAAIVGENDEHARELAAPGRLSFLRLRSGRPSTFPSPQEAAEHPWTAAERELVDAWMSSHVIGGPETVRAGLDHLVEQTGADELMVTTNVFQHADRLASYRRLAQLWGIQPAFAQPGLTLPA
jgi:luciferase family oxidoreductase group 1